MRWPAIRSQSCAQASRWRAIYQVEVDAPFDLVIISPGGHPKDINLYQAQKALAHATMIARRAKHGGTVILGGRLSRGHRQPRLRPVDGRSGASRLHEAVLARYAAEGYRIGPHKAWQIARDATRVRLMFGPRYRPRARPAAAAESRRRYRRGAGGARADLPPGARRLPSCPLPTLRSRCYVSP